MAYRFIQRNGTAAELTTRNEVLLDGELCFETDTGLYKLGDGVTAWNALGYWQLTPEFPGALTMDAIADPSAPGADKLRLYAQNIGGRLVPKVIGPSGLDNPLQSGLQANKVILISPNASTAMNAVGATLTVVGTMSHPAITAGTSLRVATQRAQVLSAATANSASQIRSAAHLCYRGEVFGSAVSGGFFFSCRWGIGSTTALQRVAVGLLNSTGAIATTQVISSLTNGFWVGWDSADTTLQFYHNDAAGSATKINLGASFPANDITAIYELVLFCAPNGSSVTYRVRRLDTGDTATGTITTDMPTASTMLTWNAYMNNGGTAAAVILDCYRMYLETDY